MRRLVLLALLAVAGCQNIRGPFEPKSPTRVDDPRLPISEQERRARDRLALPDEAQEVAPQSGNAFPGLPNRRI
jgi:hypothetical protein